MPLVAIEFAFTGGASQDPADKPGVANMVSALLDEGAGELDAKAFQRAAGRQGHRAELLAPAATTSTARCARCSENRDEALRPAAPRADRAALRRRATVERMRAQILAACSETAPIRTASPAGAGGRRPFRTIPTAGRTTARSESVPTITVDDLRAYVQRVLARDNLKIAMVGDIDAADAGSADRPRVRRAAGQGRAAAGAEATPRRLGRRIVVELDVPQAVVTFGGLGIARKDPDFMPAFIVNHILGGGSFSSRLYSEVREKRGLAYGVYVVWSG